MGDAMMGVGRSTEIALTAFLAGVGSAVAVHLVMSNRRRRASPEIPAWLADLEKAPGLQRVRLREWEDDKWRRSKRWLGHDLIHNPHGHGVRVLAYYWNPEELGTLTGIVHFGRDAESHAGLCHGGAMTSLMDDVLGHAAFLVEGATPWGGATVQVNCSLKRPVKVGQVLKIEARVVAREGRGGRKVKIAATLSGEAAGEAESEVYAELEGLSVVGVSLPNEGRGAPGRKWHRSEREIRDSGWDE
eukprot:g4346.t1